MKKFQILFPRNYFTSITNKFSTVSLNNKNLKLELLSNKNELKKLKRPWVINKIINFEDFN